MDDIYDHLLQASNVKDTGAPIDNKMQVIFRGALRVFSEKSKAYGNHLAARDPDDSIALFEAYSEINRKYIRLNKFARDKLKGEDRQMIDVADTLLDLMIYSAMALQLVLTRQEKKDAEADRSSRDQSGGKNSGGEVHGSGDTLW